MIYFIQQGAFVLRYRYIPRFISFHRKLWYSFLGMHVGHETVLPNVKVTWPHQVSIGNNCALESNITFKFDGVWQPGPSIQIMNRVFLGSGCEFNIREGIIIGNDSNIASGCRFIDHDHGIEDGRLIGSQPSNEEAIKLGDDVWLGCNVVVLKGVQIGDGAVVGAGAVVTKSILSKEIWAGVPARKIGQRSSV
jgi:acetyltransferase-like isoleucine patch superfamily enzyme